MTSRSYWKGEGKKSRPYPGVLGPGGRICFIKMGGGDESLWLFRKRNSQGERHSQSTHG